MEQGEPESSTPLSAVILAGGQGKRMKSRVPKLLHPLGGVPLVHHPIALALACGVRELVLVVPPAAEALERAVRSAFPMAPLRLAVQAAPRGTADALRCALPLLEPHRTLLILCGDVPNLQSSTITDLLAEQQAIGASVAFLSFLPAAPGAYGRVLRDESGAVQAIVEARDCTPAQAAVREVNAGIYAIRLARVAELLATVNNHNAQREFYLTDLVAAAVAHGQRVIARLAPEEEVAGVNDRADLARAASYWQQRRNGELMRAGVTIEQPATVFVDATVTLAEDVHLGPQVQLRGACMVGAGVVVEQGCVIRDVIIEEDAHLLPYCVCEGVHIGPGCSIGPFARLRPGTVLGPRVKIGNFVETKKAILGEGTKASHLAYLGDARLGRNVNVGCGTITCNFDGFRKYRTEIGDEALIGSDTQLVAPLTVGPRAVTGAGSVITNDVPAGSLAVSRGRQRIVDGYYERLRRRYLDED